MITLQQATTEHLLGDESMGEWLQGYQDQQLERITGQRHTLMEAGTAYMHGAMTAKLFHEMTE